MKRPVGVGGGQDLYGWAPRPFEEIDSTFAVQEHVQDTIRKDAANVDAILAPPEGQDELVWQYEHVRYLDRQRAREGREEGLRKTRREGRG